MASTANSCASASRSSTPRRTFLLRWIQVRFNPWILEHTHSSPFAIQCADVSTKPKKKKTIASILLHLNVDSLRFVISVPPQWNPPSPMTMAIHGALATGALWPPKILNWLIGTVPHGCSRKLPLSEPSTTTELTAKSTTSTKILVFFISQLYKHTDGWTKFATGRFRFLWIGLSPVGEKRA